MYPVSPVLLAKGFNVMWAISIPWALSLTCHIVLCSSGHNSPENQAGKYVYIHFLFMQVVVKNTGKGRQHGSEGKRPGCKAQRPALHSQNPQKGGKEPTPQGLKPCAATAWLTQSFFTLCSSCNGIPVILPLGLLSNKRGIGSRMDVPIKPPTLQAARPSRHALSGRFFKFMQLQN